MQNLFSTFEERAIRVAVDFQFNIFLYFLIIIIIILLIVIAFKLNRLNESLEEIQNWKKKKPIAKAPQSQDSTSSEQESQFGFTIGQHVIRLKDEKQLRVYRFTSDGTVICTTGVYRLECHPSELADFDAYWAEKKGDNK